MNKLDTSACTTTVGFPVKQGTLDFLQDAYTEGISAAIVAAIGSTYSATTAYRLYGCALDFISGSTYAVTAGALFYNGEVFLSPTGGTFSIMGGQTAVANLSVSQYTTNADPVTFSDTSIHDVHNIRQVSWSAGSTGSGSLTSTSASDYSSINSNSYLSLLGAGIGITSINSSITTINTNISTLNNEVALGAWTALTFNSGGSQGTWSNVSGFTARCRIDGMGRVYLQGKITHSSIWAGGNTGANSILTLPATPTNDIRIPCCVQSTTGSSTTDGIYCILIKSTGDIDFLSSVTFGSVSELSLDSISFLTT